MQPSAATFSKQPRTSGNGNFMPDKCGNPIEVSVMQVKLTSRKHELKAQTITAETIVSAPLTAPSSLTAPTTEMKRIIYSKEEMLFFKDCDASSIRPSDLPYLPFIKTKSSQTSRMKRLEEKEAIRKLREAEEDKERIRKENERKKQEEEDSRKKAATNLSLMQAKLETRKQKAKAQTIAAEQIVSAPVTAASTPSLRPSAISLRPGDLRPSQGTLPTPVAAAPVITTGLRPGGGNRFIPDTPTASTPTTGLKRISYDKQEMLSFKDCAACTIRPSDLPDLPIISTTSGRSSRMSWGDTKGVGPSCGLSVTAGVTQWSHWSQQQSTTGRSRATGVRRQSSVLGKDSRSWQGSAQTSTQMDWKGRQL